MIVSAWGRGAYIAQKLREKLLKVSVLDFSSLLQMSSVEREGPFGVFVPEHLSDEDRYYLCGNNCHFMPRGFCVVTPQKIMEFRGFLNPPTFLNQNSISLSDGLKKSLHGMLSAFRNNYSFNKSLNKNSQCSFTDPYALKEMSFQFFHQLWQSWDNRGIQRLKIKQLKNIVFKKNRVHLQTDRGEVVSRLLVWTLGALETKTCCASILPLLFSSSWKQPSRVWQRFNMSWSPNIFQDIIPCMMLIVPQFSPQKTKAHIMSFKRNPEEGQKKSINKGDLWMLCPSNWSSSEHSSSSADLKFQSLCDQYAHQAEQDLQQVFPNFSIRVKASDFSTTDIKKHQTFFVQYEKDDIQKRVRYTHPLVFHLNPERVGKIDAYSLFQWEKVLKVKLLKRLRPI